jgi:hypothetical protein
LISFFRIADDLPIGRKQHLGYKIYARALIANAKPGKNAFFLKKSLFLGEFLRRNGKKIRKNPKNDLQKRGRRSKIY